MSGRIVQLGDGVDEWSAGDEVCALLTGGRYRRSPYLAGQLLPFRPG